jgi:archaellum component FlaC
MKKILLLTILCFPVLFSWAQRKPEPKPVTAPAVRKPSGPSPYVLKKEYDSVSTSLRNQIKSLQGTIGSLKGSIGDKDNELSALALQMKQVEDLLNSTNFKIALTSDSLDQTRLSIEEVQRESNEGLLALNEQVKDLKTQLMLLWVLAIAGLGLAAYALMHSKKQIKSNRHEQHLKFADIERSLLAKKVELDEQLKSFDDKLTSESRNAQHYTERQSAILRENMQNMNDFVNGLKDDLLALSSTVEAMGNK